MILPRGYKVGYGITLRGLGLDATRTAALEKIFTSTVKAGDCGGFATWADTYRRLAAKKDKSAATRRAAAEMANIASNRYIACMSAVARVTPAPVTPAPITPAPVTPAPVTPAPVTPAPVTPAPVTVVGTPTTAYAPSTTSSGGPLPVPGPASYPDSVPAPAPVAGPVAECDLAGLGKLPLTYSDLYGPMRVLGVYGCQAATPQAAASTGQQAVDQQIQSSDLWSG